jgi:hypothetical protein
MAVYYYFVREVNAQGEVVASHEFRSIVEVDDWLLNAKFENKGQPVTYKLSRAAG